VTQWKKRSGIACDGAAEMRSGSASSGDKLPPTRGSGNEATFNIQLYLYQRVTVGFRALKTKPVYGLLYSLP